MKSTYKTRDQRSFGAKAGTKSGHISYMTLTPKQNTYHTHDPCPYTKVTRCKSGHQIWATFVYDSYPNPNPNPEPIIDCLAQHSYKYQMN